ncbi:MAG TPA: hypothetical protein VF594_10075, partial [Rubricoccaceae bacterium]
TQVDARLTRHTRYAAYLREKYGDAVLQTPIRTSSSLATTTHDGRTVFDVRATLRGAVDYAAAAAEITAALDAPSRSAPTAATPAEPAPTPPETAVLDTAPAPVAWTSLDRL